MGVSSSSFLSNLLPFWEWSPVISEKHNSKIIWHNVSQVLVRVLIRERVWGQYISAFSRWSLWVIDFIFIGICVEVISCRAPVILLRSNARGTHRQHSNSIMFSHGTITAHTTEDSFVLFSCNRFLFKNQTLVWKLVAWITLFWSSTFQTRALVNTVMAHKNSNFLARWDVVRFSRTLSYGVSPFKRPCGSFLGNCFM